MPSQKNIQMKNSQITTAITTLFLSALIFFSCKKNDTAATDTGTGTNTADTIVTNTKDTTFANSVVIKYSGTTATVTNPFEAAGVSVSIANGDVVITSTVTTTEINYVLSGNSTNGMFKLYSDYKFNLVLNGVGITNADGPAINIQSGKKVTVLVLNGTSNQLVDGSSYASSTEDQKAAFFSEGQLNFTGYGALTVKGKYKHGICSDDYIYIKEGNITFSEAVSDAIHANDYFKIDAGALKTTSAGDGIDCEEGYIAINGGDINVTSVDDGITASYEGTDATIVPYMLINGGTVTVTTTGEKGNALKSEKYTTINSTGIITLKVSGRGAKGIKTGSNCTLTNANLQITTSGIAFYDATDADIASAAGINCDSAFVMTAGTVAITSTGTAGKGITVDGTATFNGGTTSITTSGSTFTYGSSTSEAKAVKCDGALTVNSGTLNISSADDGIKSEASITVNGGAINITKSTEGTEAPFITYAGGNTNIVSSDDCINTTYGNGGENSDGSLLSFSGGTVTASSSAGDCIDGNGNVVMTGGTVIAQGPPSSPELAIDVNGTFTISGGLLIGSGPNSGNMIEATSTTSSQYTMLVKVNGNVAAGSLFNVQDASGNSLVTYTPSRSAYYFVFSSSALQSGAAYKIYTGGSSTGTATGGLYAGGTYSGGTLKGTVTISGKLTTVSL